MRVSAEQNFVAEAREFRKHGAPRVPAWSWGVSVKGVGGGVRAVKRCPALRAHSGQKTAFRVNRTTVKSRRAGITLAALAVAEVLRLQLRKGDRRNAAALQP